MAGVCEPESQRHKDLTSFNSYNVFIFGLMHVFPCMCGFIPQTFSMQSEHFVGVCVCTVLLSFLCVSGTFPSPEKNLCICEPWSVTQLFLTLWSSSVFGLHECVCFIYFLLKKNYRTRSPFCCLVEPSRMLSRLIQLWLLIRI